MDFDCIIPVAGRDCLLLRKSIPYIQKYIRPETIYIITRKSYFVYFIGINNDRIVLLDENELIVNIDFLKVKTLLQNAKYSPKNTGWYFQQFLKMGFSLSKYAKSFYLSWDADSIPVRPINFFDENGSPLFTMKEEYHKPYFITLKKILNIDKLTTKSFISENMIFKSEIMIDLIDKIDKSILYGESWCEKIIMSLPSNKNNSFSEFETYGNYVMQYYPKLYKMREIRTFRNAGLIYTRFISNKIIHELSDGYEMISLEHRHNPKYPVRIIAITQKIAIKFLNKILN